jgi:hypothetical protein
MLQLEHFFTIASGVSAGFRKLLLLLLLAAAAGPEKPRTTR